MKNNFAAIVLAAGEGKRMKSTMPKVLHEIAGKPMIARTVETIQKLSPAQIIVVASPNNQKALKDTLPNVDLVIQKEPLGTADATQSGIKSVNPGLSTVAVLYGDTPFYNPATIEKIYKSHLSKNPQITFVTAIKENPSGWGRITRKNGKIAIVEEKDATDKERQIKEVNVGLYFFDKSFLAENLPKLKPSKVTRELYLTDLIVLALKNNKQVEIYKLPDDQGWQGINTPEELEEATRKFVKKIHIMGVAGAGAAAVAGIAQAYGYQVTGCDLNPQSSYTKNLNLEIKKGHNPSHLDSINMLVISPAVLKLDPKNPEVQAAQAQNIPVLTWQEFQGKYLEKDKFVITVAGAYGKSTTTSMVAKILIDLGLDPTVEIGAQVLDWNSNFRVGHSKYYVCESDEYNNNFLNYEPDIAVILNIGWDHPDFFKTRESVAVSYKKFIGKIKKGGTLVVPYHPDLQNLIKFTRPNITVVKVEDFGALNLSIIGNFRKENANAALTVAKVLGLDVNRAKKSVESFRGTGRRLEYKGEIKGVKFYDDYAVQPYTIKSTANALKEKFKDQKVTLVLEPHTFSRIETFFDDFVKSLKETKVDKILITDVFAAREHGDPAKLAKKLVESIGNHTIYSGSLDETTRYAKQHLADFNIVLSMGAGNIYKLYDMVSKK